MHEPHAADSQHAITDLNAVRTEYAAFAEQAGAVLPAMPRTEREADQVVPLAAIDSTMFLARQMICDGSMPLIDENGNPLMAAMCADCQSAGHGRLGRAWSDEAGSSFLVTYATALPYDLVTNPEFNGWFTIEAGLAEVEALHETLDEYGAKLIDPNHDLAIKWPNDIFYDGHKLGGILTELVTLPADAVLAGCRHAVGVMFGLGLNLNLDEAHLPTPISTSLQLLYTALPDSRELRDALSANITRRLRSRLSALVETPDRTRGELLESMRALCWTLGQQVEAKFMDGSTLTGRAVAMNADASLTVEDEQGERHVVQTADVGVIA